MKPGYQGRVQSQTLSKGAGHENKQAMQDICDGLLSKATAAATAY